MAAPLKGIFYFWNWLHFVLPSATFPCHYILYGMPMSTKTVLGNPNHGAMQLHSKLIPVFSWKFHGIFGSVWPATGLKKKMLPRGSCSPVILFKLAYIYWIGMVTSSPDWASMGHSEWRWKLLYFPPPGTVLHIVSPRSFTKAMCWNPQVWRTLLWNWTNAQTSKAHDVN